MLVDKDTAFNAENGRLQPAITLGQIVWTFLTMNCYKPVKKLVRILHIKKGII